MALSIASTATPTSANTAIHILVIPNADIVTTSSTRLSAILTFIKENGSYPDPYDLHNAITEETNGYRVKYSGKYPELEGLPGKIGGMHPDTQKLSTDSCRFCGFTGMCAKRKAGEINDV